MLRGFIQKLYKQKQLKYLLPIIYLVLLLLAFTTLLIPPLNKCYGGLFSICFPVSLVIILYLAIPGVTIVNLLDFIIPRRYYSWASYGENIWQVLLINYVTTLIFLFILGFVIDKVKSRKVRN